MERKERARMMVDHLRHYILNKITCELCWDYTGENEDFDDYVFNYLKPKIVEAESIFMKKIEELPNEGKICKKV